MPACGKSTLSKKLAASIDFPCFDLDYEIEKKSGKSVKNIFRDQGEEEFRKLERSQLEEVIGTKKKFVLSCGGGTPCFYDNMVLINQSGISVYINVEVEVLVERLRQDADVRPLISEHGEHLETYLRDLLKNRSSYYEKAHLIWSGSEPVEELVAQL